MLICIYVCLSMWVWIRFFYFFVIVIMWMSQNHQLFLLFCLFCVRVQKKSCSRELQAKQELYTLFILFCNGIRYQSTWWFKDKKVKFYILSICCSWILLFIYSAHPIFNRSPFHINTRFCLLENGFFVLETFIHTYIILYLWISRALSFQSKQCFSLSFFLSFAVNIVFVGAWDWNSIMIPVARYALPSTKFSF